MTENRANKILRDFGDYFINLEGIHYVAVVNDGDNDDDDDFAIEIGVDSKKISLSQNLSKLASVLDISPIKIEEGLDTIPVGYDPRDEKIKDKLSLFKDLDIIEANSLKFQCRNNITSGKTISNEKFIYESGTIGAIVKLEGYKNELFLLSNWHVLMGETGKIGDPIVDSKGNIIGELFWAVYNDFYDLALAKITCNDFKNNHVEIRPLEDLDEIKIDTHIKKYGAITDINGSEIYSKNAFVKITLSDDRNKVFKNQILTNYISKKGDSGSLVLTGDSNKALGVIFAGDGKDISVANHIHLLVKDIQIPAYRYSMNGYNVQMPSIKFDSIFTSKFLTEYKY